MFSHLDGRAHYNQLSSSMAPRRSSTSFHCLARRCAAGLHANFSGKKVAREGERTASDVLFCSPSRVDSPLRADPGTPLAPSVLAGRRQAQAAPAASPFPAPLPLHSPPHAENVSKDFLLMMGAAATPHIFSSRTARQFGCCLSPLPVACHELGSTSFSPPNRRA